MREREAEARQEMLENLADFDDSLLEQLLEDTVPEQDEIYAQITKDLADDLIVPVLIGAAEHDNGVRRLMKALRHDVPGPDHTAERLELERRATGRRRSCSGLGMRPMPASCRSRVSFGGQVTDGQTLGDERVSGLVQPPRCRPDQNLLDRRRGNRGPRSNGCGDHR